MNDQSCPADCNDPCDTAIAAMYAAQVGAGSNFNIDDIKINDPGS